MSLTSKRLKVTYCWLHSVLKLFWITIFQHKIWPKFPARLHHLISKDLLRVTNDKSQHESKESSVPPVKMIKNMSISNCVPKRLFDDQSDSSTSQGRVYKRAGRRNNSAATVQTPSNSSIVTTPSVKRWLVSSSDSPSQSKKARSKSSN